MKNIYTSPQVDGSIAAISINKPTTTLKQKKAKFFLYERISSWNTMMLLTFAITALMGLSGWGQTTGDYASLGSGTWTTTSVWGVWNGSNYVTNGTYPGQTSGTYAVLINSGHTITIGTGGIVTQPMGTLTISGQLTLTGSGGNQGTRGPIGLCLIAHNRYPSSP